MSKNVFRALVAVTMFGVLMASDADAATRRMTILNKGEGVRSLPRTHQVQSERSRARVEIAPLQGVVLGGGQEGLRVSGRVVRLSRKTAVQSIVKSHADAALQPRVLRGRTVTIYGRPSNGGKIIDASLVIVRPEPHERATREAKMPPPSDASRYTIPGTSDACGTLLPGAPE